jgi:maltose alpha-D-glucosyltransferase/alpha-amylase
VPAGVLAHRADGDSGTMLFLHNLGTEPATADLSAATDLTADADHPNDVFADRAYDPPGKLDALELDGYGYRWIRVRRSPFP